MYLHEDAGLFREVVVNAAESLHMESAVIEKDYYVTMILKLLAQRVPEAVFKGGTSLSKCHQVIDRFSEDIDISVAEQLGQAKRKALKQTIVAISNELCLPISNIEEIKSRRDYNKYILEYQPIDQSLAKSLNQGVILETWVSTLSFPVESKHVDSYVRQFLASENEHIVQEYGMELFSMPTQSLERTLIDKVFAICDYYLQGKTTRHSRHIYDIFKILPLIAFDNDFVELIAEVRQLRSEKEVCPSAQSSVNITQLLIQMIDKGVYVEDYRNVTTYFLNEFVPYEDVVTALKTLVELDIFANPT